MTTQEIFGFAAPIIGLVAPFLVYLAARQKLTHEAHRDTVGDEVGLWERMSTMLDRYGRRADELEAKSDALIKKVNQAEVTAQELKLEVAKLRGSMTRWKNYAMALVRQIQAANLEPLNPANFGLNDRDGEDPRA